MNWSLNEPGLPPGDGEIVRRVELDPANSIRSHRVRWIWRGRIPMRSLVVIPGEKGLGKSIATNGWLPGQLTRGLLDGELEGSPVDVAIATAEDDWPSVIVPRLMAHGADLDRVHRVRVRDEAGDSLLTLPNDCPQLEAEISRLSDAGHVIAMLVVDPIGAFLSDATDSHRDASVRRALAPLAALAERQDLAVVVVAHTTKDESKRLINRVSGAGAFVNAARSVLAFARHPDDAEGEQGRERVLVHVASNWGRYAPSLALAIESREVELDDGGTDSYGYLVVKGETSIGVDEIQRGPDENGSDAEEAILAAVADGPQPSRAVKKKVADELGYSARTVERAAVRMRDRGELDIDSGGFPRTTIWALRSGDTGPDAVATPPNTVRVATDSSGVVTEIPASSSDSGDSLQPGVATGARGDRPSHPESPPGAVVAQAIDAIDELVDEEPGR